MYVIFRLNTFLPVSFLDEDFRCGLLQAFSLLIEIMGIKNNSGCVADNCVMSGQAISKN